jgi:protein SCO1/2
MTESEEAFARRAVRRKRLFLAVCGEPDRRGGLVVLLDLLVAGPQLPVGPRAVIILLILLNARQNLRQQYGACSSNSCPPNSPAMTIREVVRNPYVWGMLIGVVALTAIRPLLHRVPELPPVIGHAPELALVDSDGRPFGSVQLKGQVYIVSFFFTSCRSICPVIMHGMARLQARFDERGIDGIRLVSISVDPEHDTPEVLRAYGKDLVVKPERWTLLTGDPETIRPWSLTGSRRRSCAAPRLQPAQSIIAHTGKVVLVDGSGGSAATTTPTTWGSTRCSTARSTCF